MKRMLIAAALMLGAGGQVFAADLPPPEAPPPRAPATYIPAPVVVVYNWTGFYIGINGGGGFGKTTWTGADGNSNAFNTSGFLGGGTVGVNYQMGQFVIGAEGDGDWSNLDGKSNTGCGNMGAGLNNPNFTCESKSNWLATARGRAGWAFDRVLVYGTGGAAFGNVQAGLNGSGAPIGTSGDGGNTSAFNSTTRVGWTAGAGIEYALAPNWTVKAEYLFVDLGSANGLCTTACNFTDNKGSVKTPSVSTTFTENVVRAGLNFKFGGW